MATTRAWTVRSLALLTLLPALAVAGDDAPPGWESLSPPAPFETDAGKLCNVIDPPDRQWFFNDTVRCVSAIGDEAALGYSTARAGAVADCFAAIKAKPYDFQDFEPGPACAAYDQYIDGAIDALRRLPRDDSRVRSIKADLDSRRRLKEECLRGATEAMTTGRKLRSAKAFTAPLAVVRDVKPNLRLKEETARISAELADCQAEASRRRQERLDSLHGRSVEDLRQIEAKYRLPEEQEVIDQADAEHAALVEKRRSDPHWAGPLLSAVICIAGERKEAAAKEIRTELAYAKRYGGAVDNGKIYDLQENIRSQDEQMDQARAVLHGIKGSLQSCRVKLVKQIVACLPHDDVVGDDPACSTPEIRAYLELGANAADSTSP